MEGQLGVVYTRIPWWANQPIAFQGLQEEPSHSPVSVSALILVLCIRSYEGIQWFARAILLVQVSLSDVPQVPVCVCCLGLH